MWSAGARRRRLRRCRVRRAAPGANRRVVGAVRGVHAGARVSVLQGQRNHVGRWWTATSRSLVGYESWLERDWLMLLDFDPDVVGIAAQPFWLLWTTPEGKPCSHAPDYFARSAGGAALVMDCRTADRIKRVTLTRSRSPALLVSWSAGGMKWPGRRSRSWSGMCAGCRAIGTRATTCRTWLPLCRSRSRHRRG